MEAIDPWYLEHLVCPVDHTMLRFDGSHLVSAGNRRYPVIQGVPVMLVADQDQTLWVAQASLERAAGNRVRDEADPFFLETLGVSQIEREGIRESLRSQDWPIDPVVRYIVAQTCGQAYRSLVGKLQQHPIPEIPLPLANGEALLDIGCSWGRWSVAASRKGYTPVGIDPSLGAVLAAKRVARRLGTNCRFVVADARLLPFCEGSMDNIFSYSVLQHFSKDNVIRTLHEVARVMRPSALSLIQMANRFGARSLYHQLRRACRTPRDFEVRYWSLRNLRQTFSAIIGPTELRADCYFGLGLQESDAHIIPPIARSAVVVSEGLKEASRVCPWLVWVADSVWVRSRCPSCGNRRGNW